METIRSVDLLTPPSVSDKGEDFSFPISDGRVHLHVRCAGSVGVFAITVDGEAVFLIDGKIVDFRANLVGFVALQISAVEPFHYFGRFWRLGEDVDPVPLVVEDTMSGDDYQRLAMLDAVEAVLRRRGIVQDDDDLDGMIDEIEEELDFDDDTDADFGEGYMEQVGLEPNDEGPSEPEAQTRPAEPASPLSSASEAPAASPPASTST